MGKYGSIFKAAAAGTGGGLTSVAGFLLLGMAFGIPGFLLVSNEKKKPKNKQNMAILIIGYILMVIGVALGLGFNAEGLINQLE
jgi:formate-dependent nitrite reductase membrane component NrfD